MSSPSFLRAPRGKAKIPDDQKRLVVPHGSFTPMNCPWEENGSKCDVPLTKAHLAREHLVKVHARGIFEKPYVCVPCGKCHRELKQKESCSRKDKHGASPAIRPVEREKLLGLFVKMLLEVFPSDPTLECLEFLCGVLGYLNNALAFVPFPGPAEDDCRRVREHLETRFVHGPTTVTDSSFAGTAYQPRSASAPTETNQSPLMETPSAMVGPSTAGQFQEPLLMGDGAPHYYYDSANMPAVTDHPQNFAHPQEVISEAQPIGTAEWWQHDPRSGDVGNQDPPHTYSHALYPPYHAYHRNT